MMRYEYRVIPAPKKGEKSRAARTISDRFALAVSMVMNDLGRDGWDYVRADTLPCEERVGLTGSRTTYQHLLVFRREVVAEATVDLTHHPSLTVEPVPGFSGPPLQWPPAPAGLAPALGPATMPLPGMGRAIGD